MIKKFKIKKGDLVLVRTGKDKGKTGEVLTVLRETDKVMVRGINVSRRHTKPSQMAAGGIVEKEMSIHISNVALFDRSADKPSKVGFKHLEDGTKVRYFKASGETIQG